MQGGFNNPPGALDTTGRDRLAQDFGVAQPLNPIARGTALTRGHSNFVPVFQIGAFNRPATTDRIDILDQAPKVIISEGILRPVWFFDTGQQSTAGIFHAPGLTSRVGNSSEMAIRIQS